MADPKSLPKPPTDVKRLKPVCVHTVTAVGIQGKKKFALAGSTASNVQLCDEIQWHPLGVAVKFKGAWFVIVAIDNVECEEPKE